MGLFFRKHLSLLFRKDPTPYLASFWCTGLILGAVIAANADTSHHSLMLLACDSPVSIVRLLIVILLPLLFSAIAVLISCPWLLIPIAFMKAFLYSFVCYGVIAAFGASGWLIRLFLIFSDTFMLPVLWQFWLSSTRQGSGDQFITAGLSGSLGLLIVSLDLTVIRPFLVEILSR